MSLGVWCVTRRQARRIRLATSVPHVHQRVPPPTPDSTRMSGCALASVAALTEDELPPKRKPAARLDPGEPRQWAPHRRGLGLRAWESFVAVASVAASAGQAPEVVLASATLLAWAPLDPSRPSGDEVEGAHGDARLVGLADRSRH